MAQSLPAFKISIILVPYVFPCPDLPRNAIEEMERVYFFIACTGLSSPCTKEWTRSRLRSFTFPPNAGTNMAGITPKSCFLESVERCIKSDHFIPAFYRRFLSSSDEIRSKFRNTDFEQQNKMLARSLLLTAGATAGNPESLREMKKRAETHDRNHLNVEPRLYDRWLEAIIETASTTDQLWNDDVEAAWRNTLGYAIRHMTKRY